ncbi:MAG: bifunctional phosphoglucose/phosphomannose isomerase [candidate division Zixibacteria bacterium]|nr:bifunctional phosphoglucose/phosphomannose isomerase [candidate division Zixibacteria bacterium]
MSRPDLKALESPARYRKVDPDNFYQLLVDFPAQLRQAVEIARKFNWSNTGFRPANIIVAGLGGSAIGADLARSFLLGELNIPFHVIRHYTLPAFVGPQTLFFASSYSGNTEETLAAFDEARKKQAAVICITTGGKLAFRATGLPVITVPSGYPPRAALGFSFVPLVLILGKAGLIRDFSEEILSLADFLAEEIKKWEREVPPKKNEPKRLAAVLFGKIPLVYAGSDFLEPVAVRWKGQICENAKQPAFCNFFPEFNHNELVGFGVLKHLTGKLTAVFLEDKDDHPRVLARMKIVEDIFKKKKVPVLKFSSKGEIVLERMFYLILLGDFASYYLAILNGVNPKPVEVIDYLKGRLEKI